MTPLKSAMSFANGLANVIVVEDWPSLGTFVRSGMEFRGVVGPAIVLSGQVAERENSAISAAILLHECGHALDGTHRQEIMSGAEYDSAESAANRIAAEIIVELFSSEDWAEEAFDYLAGMIN